MPTQIGELGVTFPDTTLQTTAAIPGTPGFGLSVMSIFTSNGFFIVPAGITRVRVTVIGGGGGGGPSNYDPDSGASYVGGGGGGGGTAVKTISGLIPGASINVVVGTGGAGGIQFYLTPGQAGTTSSFGAYCSATGGGGGNQGPGGSTGGGGNGAGGYGGVGVSGDLNISGTYGLNYIAGGYGGNTILGAGGAVTQTGRQYGGGGGGGAYVYDTLNGYAGANGVVIVEY
jgi:hypothetical protein